MAAQDCVVGHNTLVDNRTGIVLGSGKKLPPKGIDILANLIVSDRGTLVLLQVKDATFVTEENVMFGGELGIPPREGITVRDPKLKQTTVNGYPYAERPDPFSSGEQLYAFGRLKPLRRSDSAPRVWAGRRMKRSEQSKRPQTCVVCGRRMGPIGFEPTTSSLSGTRSNQLSYEPAGSFPVGVGNSTGVGAHVNCASQPTDPRGCFGRTAPCATPRGVAQRSPGDSCF